MKIDDLETVSALKAEREQILGVQAKVEAGETIALMIGGDEVPISRPELIDTARYQLGLHFKSELERIEQELTDLGVTVDTEGDSS